MRLFLQNPHKKLSMLSTTTTKSLVSSMGSKHFFLFKIPPLAFTILKQFYTTSTCSSKRLLPASFALKHISDDHTSSLKTNGFASYPQFESPPAPTHKIGAEFPVNLMRVLEQKVSDLGFEMDRLEAKQYNSLLCVQEFSSMNVSSSEMWVERCPKTKAEASSRGVNSTKAKTKREITVQSLELEPLCDQLLAYFKERMISPETLRRTRVMQKKCANQEKEKEKDTDKIFYGLDDIEGESDIIIVEGEIDKLSMEEAGFLNCVSVPDGASASVNPKDLPPQTEDKKYQYLWNCKEYLKKASRIIFATNEDPPGQALAEELARRLGKERCWRVKWPKKNDVGYYKDANEVLMFMGSSALKEVIDNAELYPNTFLF